MENKIEIFKNEELGEVRSLTINGEPWFVGKDVAIALGYKDTSDALKVHVDEEDKGVGEMPTPGGKQNMITINESGLYSLIFNSKLPSAKKFKSWVTKEILPSIRKHGMYITEELLKDKEKLQQELDSYWQEYYKLEHKTNELELGKKIIESKNKELEEISKEYALQRRAIIRLKIKTNEDESYLPGLVMQVIRNYINNNPDCIINERDERIFVKRTELYKELRRLIIRDRDILEVLYSMGMNIQDRIITIPNKFMDKDYEPIGKLY